MCGALIPAANTRNHEAAPAYALTPKHQLAQLAVTGTLNHTFYAEARHQLEDILQGFAVDASVVKANSSRHHRKAPDEIDRTDAQLQKRAVSEISDEFGGGAPR